MARQLDAVLLDAGFSASRPLLEHVGALAPAPAMDLAATVVSAVRELVGDHVRHNASFLGSPHDVPDTVEFWVEQLRAAVLTGDGTVSRRPLRSRSSASTPPTTFRRDRRPIPWTGSTS